jgi:hypothetical protein
MPAITITSYEMMKRLTCDACVKGAAGGEPGSYQQQQQMGGWQGEGGGRGAGSGTAGAKGCGGALQCKGAGERLGHLMALVAYHINLCTFVKVHA